MSRPVELFSLGGCGGFGMNAALLVMNSQALLLDFGIGFPRVPLPGAALTVPDAGPLSRRFPDLAGVVLTHAHDDHCGGLAYLPDLWSRAPVYGPGLALAFASDRMDDLGIPRPRFCPVTLGETVSIGPFNVTFIPTTHSVPDTAILAIETPQGFVVHSSDFKFDPTPVSGPLTDEAALAQLGRKGVRMLLVDSTGARREGRTGSESSVREALSRAINGARRQVFVSSFASHIHRIQTALSIAQASGRQAALLGKRMTRAIRHGLDLGLFDAPAGVLVPPDRLASVPPERRLWLAGGCQGEPQSALGRLSSENDTRAEVQRGDRVILSSSTIPGNEMPVSRLVDRLLRLGAEVLAIQDDPGLHVSGHGSRGDILHLLDLLRPEIVVPIHGDRLHMEACAELAGGAPQPPRQVLLIEKGDHLELHTEGAAVTERLELFTLYLDESGIALTPDVLGERQQLAQSGVAVLRIRLQPGAPKKVESIDLDCLGIPHWQPLAQEAIRTAQDALQSSAPWMSVVDIKDELARRVGNVLKRENRFRPPVLVFLE